MENFEEQLRKGLHQFLLSTNEVDERMPVGKGEKVRANRERDGM